MIEYNKWYLGEQWHDDYGDCLFCFFKNNNYSGTYFTSPLSSDWTDNDLSDHDEIFFQKIDFTKLTLRRHPKEETQ